MSALEAISGALALLFPALRQDSETKQGPHRSATPESMQMKDTAMFESTQGKLAFIREGQATFTPVQAQMVLDHCRYERQRDETKAQAHIGALAEQMRRGLWLPKTQIDFARVGGQFILVNGHHRMHAQIAAAANILWNVVIHDCADDAEVAGLYWKFDTTLRKRSDANVLKGIGFAESTGLNKTVAAALWKAAPTIANGLRFYRYQNNEKNLLPDEKQAIAEGYVPEALIAQSLIDDATPMTRMLLRSSSRFALMLVTLRHCPDRAYEFWKGVCEDDGLTKGDPRKSLLVDFQTRSGARGLQAQHMMAIARCWNAWHAGQTLKHVKVTGHAIALAGTPYTVRA